jgi:hypothetical protein
MTEIVYNRGKFQTLTQGVPSAADLRMAYFVGTETGVTNDPDLNTVADVEAVTGVTVSTERLPLTNETITEDDTNNRAEADADTVSFAAQAETAAGVIIYYEGGGTDATRLLLAAYSTGFPQPVNGGLDVNIPNGFLRGT